jgi:hypothetical protein
LPARGANEVFQGAWALVTPALILLLVILCGVCGWLSWWSLFGGRGDVRRIVLLIGGTSAAIFMVVVVLTWVLVLRGANEVFQGAWALVTPALVLLLVILCGVYGWLSWWSLFGGTRDVFGGRRNVRRTFLLIGYTCLAVFMIVAVLTWLIFLR